MNLEIILRAYIACALWSSTDDNDEPLDANYDEDSISPESLIAMRKDVLDFVTANKADLEASRQDDAQIGHDFWLTRNGHGAGFWDRGLGAVGNRLTEACKPYGGVDLYVGDDNLIHQL